MDERVRGASSAHWRTQEMFLLQEVMNLIGKGIHLDQVAREMLHLLSEIVGLNRGRIVLKDPDGDGYRIAYSYGLTREEAARGRYAAGEGITGRVIKDGHLIIVQDIDKDPVFLGRAVERARLPRGAVSFLALPIRVDHRTVGAIACHRIRHRERALSDDLTILRIIATMVSQLLTLNERVERKTRALEEHNDMLARELRIKRARYGIIGTSPALLRALGQVEKVANATASVLLLGESGSGKELFARALHLASPRRDRPFIKVNCAAIPDSLFESELFGHERGAFTGAVEARAGWFEQASGGTIFLDEIGEMPASSRPSCCAPCRRARWCAWAARGRSGWTCASWPPRTATSPPRSPMAASGRTCSTGSTSCRSPCPRSPSGAATSPTSSSTSSRRRTRTTSAT